MADQPSNGLTPQQVNDAQHLDNMTSLQQPSAAEQSPITQNGEVKGDVLISSPPTPSPDNPSLFNEPKNPNNKVVEVESQKITEFLDEGEVSDTPSDQGSKYTEDLKGLSGDAINLIITADANEQGIPDEKRPELDPGVNKAGGNTGNQGLTGGGGMPRAGQVPAGTPAAASPANPSSPTSQPNSPTSSQPVEPGTRTEPAAPPPPPAPPTQNLITPQAQFIPEQAKVNAPSILAPDAQTIPEDSTAVGNVLNNDSDVDSALAVTSFSVNGVTYTPGQIAVLPGIGSLTIASDGSYLFTPQPNWNGVVPTIDYTTNSEKQSTLNILVTPVDDFIAVKVVLTADASVVEGAPVTYTATLYQADGTTPFTNNPYNEAITVNLTGGGSITIAANAVSGTTTKTVSTDDYINDQGATGELSQTISSVSLATSTPESLTAVATAAVTDVLDDTDAVKVVLTADASVVEGAPVTYTATLYQADGTTPFTNNPYNEAITVNLTGGGSITIAANAVSGTTTKTVSTDDYINDQGATGELSQTISSVSLATSTPESLTAVATAAVTDVLDDTDAVKVVLTADASVVEGAPVTYTATLYQADGTTPFTNNPYNEAITVNLTGGGSITIAANAVSGTTTKTVSTDDYINDQGATGELSQTISSVSLATSTPESLTAVATAAVTDVLDDTDAVKVVLTADASVVEGAPVTYTATLYQADGTTPFTNNPYNEAITVNLTGGGSITIAANAVSGTTTKTVSTDDYINDQGATGELSQTISSVSLATSTPESLTAVATAAVTDVLDDTDAITLKVVACDVNGSILATPTMNSGTEGATLYYKVLAYAPDGTTVLDGIDGTNVTVAFNNGTASISDYTPVATTVKIGEKFSAALVDDGFADNGETYTVSLAGSVPAQSLYEAVNLSTSTVTSTITDSIRISDISIWKSGKVYDNIALTTADANNQVDVAGDFIQYEVVVKNTGENTLTGIKFTDEKLPAGGYTLQVGTYNEITGVFTASGSTVTATASNGELSLSNDLFVSQALRLVYVYDVTADDIYSNKISNTIQVDTAQTDPEYKDVLGVANDGVASYEVLVEGISDVAIRKFADVHTAKLADTINYKLIVTNEGTTNLTNVQVADKMFATAPDVNNISAGKQIAGYIYTDGIKASTATNFTVDGAGNLVIGTLSTNQYVEINYSHTITTSDYSIVTTGLVESVFDYTGISKGPYNPDGNSATADPITMSYGTFSAYVNKTTADPYATGGTAANIFINTDNTGVAIGVNAGVMSGDRNYNSDHLKAVFNTSSLNGGKSLVEKASIVFTNAKDVEVAFKAGYGTAGNTFTGSITVSNDGTVSLREVVGGVFTSVLSPAKSGSTTTFTNGQLSFSVSEANGPGGAQNKLYTLEFKPGTEFVKDFDFWVVGDPTDNSSDQIKVVDVLFDTIDFSVPNVTNTAIVTSTEDNAIDQSDEIATVNVALLANLSTSAAQYLGALTTATNIVADAEAVLSTSGSVQWQYTKSNTTLGIQLPKITIADADNNPTTVTNFKYTLEINGSVINSDSVTSNEVTFNLSGLTGTKTGVFHLYTFDNAGGRTEFISSGITIDTSKNTATGSLASFSNVAPIAFDLNGDGVLYLAVEAGVGYDFNGDGIAESTAWIAGSDGLLANQRADGSLNVVFSRETGETDLQGLAKVYDTNRDNVFDAKDAGFNDFGVWQDANSDGIVQEGEFRSLTDRGIISLSLTSDGVINTAADGDVTIYGQTTYTMTDGSTGIAEDVAFAISSVATDGDGIQDIYQIASVTDAPIIVEQFSADDRDRIDLSSILNPTSSVQSTISIDADGSTSTHANITVNIGGVDYEVATLYGKDIGVGDALGTHPGGASLTDSLNGASWTDVVDISSDHGGPASIFAEGGSLTNSYSNEAGDWTVRIKSGTATVDAANKQITFSSENAENLAIITTADGTSHEIANVDKILWH